MNTLTGLADLFGIRAVLIGLMIFVPLERLFSLHPEQAILRKGLFTDFCYATLNSLLGNILAAFLLVNAISAAAALLPLQIAQTVAGQSLWVQVLEVVIITDLGVYIAHRMFHAVPFLWRFHSIHHAVVEMDCLAAFHTHPVDLIVTKSMALLPVFFLGFSGQAVFIYYLIYVTHAMLIHANVRLNFGPLRWLIASPQFHHWHHANERKAYDKNFAGQLAIIDLIFGTYRVPTASMPAKYGVDEGIPSSYFGQVGHPFIRSERASAKTESVPSTKAA
jgi:sterol desaturase/sphingolipid hydroxylase (fatty acid hydroxylase superfamily)